jgi:Hg(II)-responsive transcriptional regulator
MKWLRIGEVAQKSGVGVETIRFYERKGLLHAPVRKASGYRQYQEADVSRIHFIKRAKVLGFTLNEIQELLELSGNDSSDRKDVRAKVKTKIGAVESKISDLVRIRDSLTDLVSRCHGSGPLDDCPIINALLIDQPINLSNHS